MENNAIYRRRPTSGPPKFESDPINSTYRWEFYLTPGHQMNKVCLIDGYSKGLGYENPNKVILLYRKLINPLLPYLSRCDTVSIYEQETGLPKEYHTKLIDLFPHGFKTFGWVKDDLLIGDFLETYYTTHVKNGTVTTVEDRRKNVRQAVYQADLDHSKYTFRTMSELRDFCRTRVEKHSKECMTIWYYKHADFQPELFSNDTSEALAQTVHTAPSAEIAQAALHILQAKYQSNRV